MTRTGDPATAGLSAAVAVVAAGMAALSLYVGVDTTDLAGLLLAFVVPGACFLVVGAARRFWLAMVLALTVGVGGTWLGVSHGYDPPGDDDPLRAFAALLVVPLLLAAVIVGLLLRLGWEEWRDRRPSLVDSQQR